MSRAKHEDGIWRESCPPTREQAMEPGVKTASEWEVEHEERIRRMSQRYRGYRERPGRPYAEFEYVRDDGAVFDGPLGVKRFYCVPDDDDCFSTMLWMAAEKGGLFKNHFWTKRAKKQEAARCCTHSAGH